MSELDKYLKQPLGKKRINKYDPCENAEISHKFAEIRSDFYPYVEFCPVYRAQFPDGEVTIEDEDKVDIIELT